jgi:thiol-disulfide isomerase/thioredoxin
MALGLRSRSLLVLAVLALVIVAAHPAGGQAANKPTAKQALEPPFVPVQKNEVEYDVPDAKAIDKCTVEAETIGGITGWVVRDAGGQILRRFLDSNSDNKVDQWCYFKDGIEVYRDIDSNFNNKADQYRWMGTAGSRWGLDEDENTRIESWKVISAEEVTAEIVAALRDANSATPAVRDAAAARFRCLLLTADELKSLGLSSKQVADIGKRIETAAKTFAEVARQQRIVTASSEWIHFGANKPGIVPAGTEGSTKDLLVYDNVTAVVETGAAPAAVTAASTGGTAKTAPPAKHGQLAIGTLIKIGDTWKTFDVPKNLTGDQTAVTGYFFQPSIPNRPDGDIPAGAGNVSGEMKKLVDDLEQLDKRLVAARPADQDRLNAQRADLLDKIIQVAPAGDREIWVKQYAETVAAAIQSGTFPDGIRRLQSLLTSVSQQSDAAELLPYIKFRLITAEYNRDIGQKDANFDKIQTKYQDDLKEFIGLYARSEDAAEAMLQLAIASEFAGKTDDAVSWFTRITTDFPKSDLAPKAIGAKRRLDSVGKTIPLAGKTIDGKQFDLARDGKGRIVLIHYWATWADPCKPDMETIKSLVAKYGKEGFAAIGVNIDTDAKAAMNFARAEKLGWPQLYEQGGLDSSLATNLGVLTLPTMILVGKDGRVINRSINAGELETELKKLMPR